MKTGDLLLIGGICLAAYWLMKQGGLEDLFNFGGGGGGLSEVISPLDVLLPTAGGPRSGSGAVLSPVNNLTPPILSTGSVIRQLASPGISYNSPSNLVLVGANVRSGGITVIPAYSPTPASQAPRISQPQAPLKIQTILGFPVVPKLSATVPIEPIVRGKGAYNKPGGM